VTYCRPLDFIFAKTTQIVSDFFRFQFFKVGKFAGKFVQKLKLF